ncbi:MAG: DUF6429 family protein [Chloroflexota bacterium]
MEYDTDKVDEATLALLYLVMFSDDYGTCAWKSFDWDSMDRLYEKGYISNPKSKARSVAVTPEGERRAAELFELFFGASPKGD